MTRVELLKILEIKREEAIALSKRYREKGNEIEAQFQLGRQAAFLTSYNLVHRYVGGYDDIHGASANERGACSCDGDS